MSDDAFTSIEIGAYDASTKSVTVTYEHPSLAKPWSRAVNACLDADGAYDEAATRQRVDSVTLGTAQKIAVGVIRNMPEPPADAEVAA